MISKEGYIMKRRNILMKRKISIMALLMLVVVLFMSGCGSLNGSSQTKPNVGSGSGDNGGIVIGESSANPGFIVLNFQQGSSKALVLSSVFSNLPSAQWVRVVVRHFTTGTDPEIGDFTVTDYKQITDVDLSLSTTTSIPVPPNDGYQVDIVSYMRFPDHKTLLKYGKATGVNITAGLSTTVPIIAVPVDAGLTPPTSIASGTFYVVAINFGDSPLRNEKNLFVSYDTPITTVSAYSNIAPFPSFQRTANSLNVADSAQTLYFQGLFFLSDDLLNPTIESWKDWRYYEPNFAEFGDAQVTSTLLPPGAIIIDVTL
jgi:hypothetical protein